MKRIAQTFLILFCLINTASAQLLISGKVIDKATDEPIQFAGVSVKGTSVGVVTNELGEFDLTIEETMRGDSLMVTILGYETYTRLISSINTSKKMLIKMTEATILLDEVTVESRDLTPKEIVQRAIKRIEDNYPTQKYALDGFYRDYKKEDGKYVALLEAAVSVYDKGYSTPSNKFSMKEDVYLHEIRKSKAFKFRGYFARNYNIMETLLTQNDVRYVKRSLNTRRNKYKLDNYTIMDGKWVYILKTEGPWVYTIYIEEDTYAVLQIDLQTAWNDTVKNEWVREEIKYNSISTTKKVIFRKYNGLYYLDYVNLDMKMEAFDAVTNKPEFTCEFYQEMVINKVYAEDLPDPDKNIRMETNALLEWQNRPYNEAFWKNYNILKESPLNAEILRDLEEKQKLEDQFVQSGNEPSADPRKKKKRRKQSGDPK